MWITQREKTRQRLLRSSCQLPLNITLRRTARLSRHNSSPISRLEHILHHILLLPQPTTRRDEGGVVGINRPLQRY